jgi:hypothetical protein
MNKKAFNQQLDINNQKITAEIQEKIDKLKDELETDEDGFESPYIIEKSEKDEMLQKGRDL